MSRKSNKNQYLRMDPEEWDEPIYQPMKKKVSEKTKNLSEDKPKSGKLSKKQRVER